MITVKTSVVGHFAHKDVPALKVGEAVELRPMNDNWSNHIGVFNTDGQMVGSIVSNLKVGDRKRGCVNNDAIINSVKNKWHYFKVIEVVRHYSDFIFVIEGVFYTPDVIKPKKDFLNRVSNPEEIAGPISYNQFIGNKAIRVELVGVTETDKLDEKGHPIKAWTWLDESDRVHKRGPASKALNRAIAEAKANSGDIVGIMFRKGWIVKKL